jgi:hypothetical protein
MEARRLTSKILAYIAAQGTFCSVSSVFSASWDKPFDEHGSDSMAFERQVSYLCDQIRQLTGSWKPYLIKKSDGIGLVPGSYRTDVEDFEKCYADGIDETKSKHDRLGSLQKARGHYRTLLVGMNSEWIVKPEGPRDRLAKMNDEVTMLIELLQQKQSTIVSYEPCAIQGAIGKALEGVREEVWIYSQDTLLLLPTYEAVLLRKLEEGVTVRLMHLGANGNALDVMAKSKGISVETMKLIAATSTAMARNLQQKWHSLCRGNVQAANRLEIKVFDAVIHGQICVIDAATENGLIFILPFIAGADAGALSGYRVGKQDKDAFVTTVEHVRRLFKDTGSSQPSENDRLAPVFQPHWAPFKI